MSFEWTNTDYIISEHGDIVTVRIVKVGDEQSNKCITFNNEREARAFIEKLLVGSRYDTEYEWQVGMD